MSLFPISSHTDAPTTDRARPDHVAAPSRPGSAEIAHAQRVANSVSRASCWTRSDLREDLQSAAMLAYFETHQRFDERRGVPPAGHAYLRMRGSVLDLLQREHRHRGTAQDASAAMTTLDTERVRARVTVQRLLAAAEPELSRDERVVLREVYLQGRQLNDVGDEQGWSKSQGVRRNQSLLDRLRRAAGVALRAAPAAEVRTPRA